MLHDQRLAYPRYWAPVYPALLLMVAIGVQYLSVRKAKGLQATLMGCLVLSAVWLVPGFVAFLRQPLPATDWRTLAAASRRVEGKKAIFFRTGFYGQMLAYPARNDASLVILTGGYPPPAGLNAGAAGAKRLRAAFVKEQVGALAGETRCFFHADDQRTRRRRWARDRTFTRVFVPLMEELGYEKVFELRSGTVEDPFHDAYYVRGYCRSL